MRRTFVTGAGLIATLGVVTFAVGASGAAAKPAGKAAKIRCTSTVYNVSYPQLSGLLFGVLKCSKPFGAGVQEGTSKATIVGTQLSVTGKFKNFFDNGTNHGTIKLSGTISSGAITASGSVMVTGGTGAYKHMKAEGKTTCTTTDGGKTYSCTVSGTLKS